MREVRECGDLGRRDGLRHPGDRVLSVAPLRRLDNVGLLVEELPGLNGRRQPLASNEGHAFDSEQALLLQLAEDLLPRPGPLPENPVVPRGQREVILDNGSALLQQGLQPARVLGPEKNEVKAGEQLGVLLQPPPRGGRGHGSALGGARPTRTPHFFPLRSDSWPCLDADPNKKQKIRGSSFRWFKIQSKLRPLKGEAGRGRERKRLRAFCLRSCEGREGPGDRAG